MKKRLRFTTKAQTLCREIVLFCALAAPLMASALRADTPVDTFDLNDPQQRQAFVDVLRERRRPGIERAEDYLRRTGKPKRWTNGQTVCELMSIEEDGQFIVYMTTNANSAISIAADIVRDDPYYGMLGDGITAGVWDAGIALPTHQELVGRVISKDTSAVVHYHSTAVTGTIAAMGIDPAATGMAPLVQIWGYEWTEDNSEMAAVAMSSPDQSDKIQISNHSYGNICGWSYNYSEALWYWYGVLSQRESFYFGQYHSLAQSFDQVCYNAPYFLPFRGAGNDRGDGMPGEGVAYRVAGESTNRTFYSLTGPYADNWDSSGFDTLMPGACAKNVLTIGAVNDAVTDGIRDLSKATMTSFSAWGPTDDGRVKPDLVTNGITVYSCNSSGDTSYITLNGTSMSSPAAAGAAVQLLNLYGQLFPGQYMRSSTLKALMIHSADDLGNPGPDYKFGWGLINTEKSAQKLLLHKRNPTLLNIKEDSLKNSNPYDHFTFVWDGVRPIKATLCYTDPAGSTTGSLDDRTSKLTNDLDIVITAPNGTPKYYEFVLDWLHPDVSATRGDNDRDNVKQVLIESPTQQGTYTIRVNFETGSGPQYYSLIISGQAQPAVYDIDGDGEIGLGDLISLAQYWMTNTAACDIFPAVGDGLVDMLDFSLLSQKWPE